jgi:methyl-accepting chemotaxis protein
MLSKMNRSLRLKMMLLLGLLITGTLLGIGLSSHYISSSVLENATKSELQQWTNLQSKRILSFLNGVESDIHFLAKVVSTSMIRVNKQNGRDSVADSSNDIWKTRLAKLFLHFAQSKPQYMQVRYLGKDGHELVRIDSDGTKAKVIEPDKLQNKSEYRYFSKTAKLSNHEIYISPLNLNQERGEIERPFKPVIRYATPIFDKENNTFEGIIVLNVFAKFILEPLDAKEDARIYLLNREGYYLKNSFDHSKEWDFMLKQETRIQRDFEEEFNQICPVMPA